MFGAIVDQVKEVAVATVGALDYKKMGLKGLKAAGLDLCDQLDVAATKTDTLIDDQLAKGLRNLIEKIGV